MDDTTHITVADVAPEEEESTRRNGLESRAYQIEMYQQSMQGNAIIAMETGSGKTQIAKLRIEAELERSPFKRIWFCAPSVVLAQQQHIFLSSHLPTYKTRLITGLDNVQFWSTQNIWDAVLDGINVVVSTPQILLDALSHGFVSLRQLSLLVFDEAHHCIANEPLALIMHRFYHPLKRTQNPECLPHILGLTASPVTNKASMLFELEKNMSAVCKTPTIQVEDYKRHVYLPSLERLSFTPSMTGVTGILRALKKVVAELSLNDDPTVKWLRHVSHRSTVAEQKLAKILLSGRTPVMKQLNSFLGHAEYIYHQVGPWSADLYVRCCAVKLHNAVILHEALVPNLADQEQRYLDLKLQSVLKSEPVTYGEIPTGDLIASKTQAVIRFLEREYRPEITVIIFVKRRSVAFALTRCLQMCPQMKHYEVFSFVGAANPTYRSLVDLADMELQNEAFADFQAGRRNICVATQVMEEGVDVQATNVVIRFDEPENFRSFIQSRGRARRPDSKFVMVQPAEENDSVQKIDKWHELEHAMKEQYSDLTRALSDREAVEEEIEEGNEFYHVAKTSALLTYDNARQHLEHFCATLPWENNEEPAKPTMIVSGPLLGPKSAQVILPSSVPPSLQVTSSLRTWRTEKMAKKDAAFQTYKRLHTASLVNDNLLPYPRVRKQAEKLETRDSLYEVQGALNPWTPGFDGTKELLPAQQHRVRVSGDNFALPDMLLLLPVRLDHTMSFTLRSTTSGSIAVSVSPEDKPVKLSSDLACRITRYLFTTILGRRLKRANVDSRLPYLAVPYVALNDLPTWFQQVQRETPLSELTFNSSLQRGCYLLKRSREEILHMWTPSYGDQIVKQYSSDETVTTDRLSKQLDYFLPNQEQDTGNEPTAANIRTLPVHECLVQGLPAAYGTFMLLMPSISYMLELASRGHLATRGPLRPIGYSKSDIVTKALVSSSALSEHNFEALEFLGDSLLKYHASIHVFFNYPELTEGGLSNKYSKIVGNAYLQRMAKELGLDAYITVEHFSGPKWTLDVTEKKPEKRRMSSKTLADVIEALIGAAFLDERNQGTDNLSTSALSCLLPGVSWKPPTTHVQEYLRLPDVLKTRLAGLDEVEHLLGYQFKHNSLLAEALTRSSVRVGVRSFQRLEFLGDAILDRIVNVALYKSGLDLDPERLKYRRDALVNRWFLAFLAMEAHHVTVTNEVTTTVSGDVTITPASKVVRLVDYTRTLSDRNEVQQRQRAETTFEQAREEILSALGTGNAYPWSSLVIIDAAKAYSDIVESIIAAVFIDSSGSLSSCESVLESLGLMNLLRRLVTEPDFEVIQPIVRLRNIDPEIAVEENETGKAKTNSRKWSCSILRGGKLLANATSTTSQKHAEVCAAALALEKLNTNNKVDEDMTVN